MTTSERGYPQFKRGDKIWVLIDGKRYKATYDENNADGFHYVKVTDAKAPTSWGKLFRVTASEITERWV